MIRIQRLLSSLALLLLLAVPLNAADDKPFFFLQLTDPQFGMYAQNADFARETANFEFAIATANRLKPAFVIVTGDLVNKPGDKAQIDEYLRIAAKLDRAIPIYHVAGNHDVGNDPTPESVAAFTARFGPDHYAFRHGKMAGIVIDSNLTRAPKAVSELARQQDAWLKTELQKANREGASPVIVFQHHPWFLEKVDEPDGYFNMPVAQRKTYLGLFRQHGVSHVFAGHYHSNQTARDDALEMVTTGPVGKPMRNDASGMRVVIVRGPRIEHRYYPLGELPQQVDLSPPKKDKQ